MQTDLPSRNSCQANHGVLLQRFNCRLYAFRLSIVIYSYSGIQATSSPSGGATTLMIARCNRHPHVRCRNGTPKRRDQTCSTRGVRAGFPASGGREGTAEAAHCGGARHNGPLHQHGSEPHLVTPRSCMRASVKL